jgi:hypothetical protein
VIDNIRNVLDTIRMKGAMGVFGELAAFVKIPVQWDRNVEQCFGVRGKEMHVGVSDVFWLGIDYDVIERGSCF